MISKTAFIIIGLLNCLLYFNPMTELLLVEYATVRTERTITWNRGIHVIHKAYIVYSHYLRMASTITINFNKRIRNTL